MDALVQALSDFVKLLPEFMGDLLDRLDAIAMELQNIHEAMYEDECPEPDPEGEPAAQGEAA